MQISVRALATVTTCEENAIGINYFHPNQTERFIAAGRVTMIAFSLLAVYLHPVEPARHVWIINSLLCGYLVYAIGLTVALWGMDINPYQFERG